MPPWFIDKIVGIQDFKDDVSLSVRGALGDAELRRLRPQLDPGVPD